MTISILDLSYRARSSGGGEFDEKGVLYRYPPVPFLIVNCVFKVSEDDKHSYSLALQSTKEFRQVVKTGSPEEEDEKFKETWENRPDDEDPLQHLVNVINSSPVPEQFWTYQDTYWNHIEKFDVFWFREWVSDCPTTRAVLKELREFQTEGKFLTNYRSVDEGIFFKHLETLYRYWD